MWRWWYARSFPWKLIAMAAMNASNLDCWLFVHVIHLVILLIILFVNLQHLIAVDRTCISCDLACHDTFIEPDYISFRKSYAKLAPWCTAEHDQHCTSKHPHNRKAETLIISGCFMSEIANHLPFFSITSTLGECPSAPAPSPTALRPTTAPPETLRRETEPWHPRKVVGNGEGRVEVGDEDHSQINT